jgi:polyisoprenyl-phosphate glycosyltransferase
MTVATVILPACNEAQALPAVISSIWALSMDLEIIVVDDGSSDGTGDRARSLGIKVIHHPLTLGAGRSVKDGIDHASCERIIMMDADCTYPADRIPEFLKKLDEGFDLVVGARHGPYYHSSFGKTFARFCFRMIAQFATGKRIPDINSGMRAFHKSRITPYFPHLCEGFSLPTTMTLAYFFTGRKVCYVPIDYYKRVGYSKVRIVADSLRSIQYIVESIAHFNPLKLFLALSVFSILAGFLMTPFLGWAPPMLGFFTAIIVFALGVIAESMRRPRN